MSKNPITSGQLLQIEDIASSSDELSDEEIDKYYQGSDAALTLNQHISKPMTTKLIRTMRTVDNIREIYELGDFGETLGSGTTGTVMVGTHKMSGKRVAVKFMPKKKFQTRVDRTLLKQELAALQSLDHPHLTQVF